ncbi:MAG: methyltransferase domain-containing protein [Polaromonas sp.]|nr:methyltransferase domain-containing protein [Polaromonas sp.]
MKEPLELSMRQWQTGLTLAQSQAQSAHFPEMLGTCQQIISAHSGDANALLSVGSLLLNFGYLTRARDCFERVQLLAPQDLRAQMNLANLARDGGDHATAQRLYEALQIAQPNHPVIRRNALVNQEYNPAMTDAQHLANACAWGDWAMAQAGGLKARPPLRSRTGPSAVALLPLRIGYVSADLCQHTVGLFVKDVLQAHKSPSGGVGANAVTVFAYSSGQVSDWVSDAIRAACTWREVAGLDDAALAALIRQDQIDVLIDLSGHTAGSRLTVFAHRPAPVQVAWLGYFATTGLRYMDAVLLDEWHAPAGTQAQFAEPIVHLPGGRMCYQPVPWAPAVAPPPCLQTGHITFGCFNNTGKLNAGVFDVWSQVLAAVPQSRLVLKWRSLADEPLCDSIRMAFADRGIDPSRIELRPASFHADVLQQYADIDIALDPFPFTGGLTSCEALWMGVPVITWPQSRVVSRQTFAFLSAIGLVELAAKDAADYVHIAQTLAADRARLTHLRSTLRSTLQASPLMDVAGFTRQLEATLSDLHHAIKVQEEAQAMNPKTVLHVGPGHRQSGAKLPIGFQGSEWQEIRLDIDPGNEPDMVGSMLDMAAVATGSVDAIYSAHNIEHVYAHEVPLVLAEFLRVLKPSGVAVITCPDLQTVCALVADNKLTDAAYNSPAGPITPLDILYGHSAAVAAGHHFMAHKTGFTEKSLTQALQTAGFQSIASKRRASGLDLWMLASKAPLAEAEIRTFASRILPN